jgi:hypothetical protein
MSNYIITNWENDLIDSPEEKVVKFVSEKYPAYYFKFLPALKQRSIKEIYDSLRESRVIVMQPSLFDKEQVVKIVTQISHPIHINNGGARREMDIRDFVFLSANPFADLQEIKEICYGKKDYFDSADALCVILHSNIEVHFYGFSGEHYEMKQCGYTCRDIDAVRHK